MRVSVVGAGKMGLPLACQLALGGAEVFSCDVNPELVAMINRGEAPFDEPGLDERLSAMVKAGRLRATTDTPAAVAASDVVIVIVPALLTPEREADTSILQAVAAQLATSMKPGTMVSFETTLPVGTTRRVLLPVLERGGLVAGKDFDLVYSPERVKSQHVFRNLTVNPKVVGGLTTDAAARGAAFYGTYLGAPVTNVATLEAAEMVKLAGMLYRDVNIALANELARYAEAVGVDLPSLYSAINSDGEAALLQPGIGVGGHCTPVYPYFLIRDAERIGVPATLADRSRLINDGQARHAVEQLERAWAPVKGRQVCILGLAFRPQVKEHICSSAFLIRDVLAERGAQVTLHDPLYSDDEVRAHGFVPATLDGATAPEVLILQTAHTQFAALDFARLRARGLEAVVDGRNVWDPKLLRQVGLTYVGVGRPPVARTPAEAPVPIARPFLGGEEAEAAARVIRSGWVLQGPEVAAFERELAAFTGAPHACALSSGTAALHLALLACGVGPGDEVITVSHSYIATANSVRLCGADPVFVDIDSATFNLDPQAVEAAITPRTKAILCVHQMGMPCDLTRLVPLARNRGLFLVEDAACAAGSEILWQGSWERIGKPHGDLATFSFHPRKLLTTGDGGVVTTASAELDHKVRLLRQHGMATPDAPATVVAFNYRLTDIQAAVGRRQLQRLSGLVAERRQQAARYHELLARLPGVVMPAQPTWARTNWQSYCTILRDADPVRVIAALAAKNIASRRGIMNAHEEPAYRDTHGAVRLPASERARRAGLMLPLYPGLDPATQQRVVAALAETLI